MLIDFESEMFILPVGLFAGKAVPVNNILAVIVLFLQFSFCSQPLDNT